LRGLSSIKGLAQQSDFKGLAPTAQHDSARMWVSGCVLKSHAAAPAYFFPRHHRPQLLEAGHYCNGWFWLVRTGDRYCQTVCSLVSPTINKAGESTLCKSTGYTRTNQTVFFWSQ